MQTTPGTVLETTGIKKDYQNMATYELIELVKKWVLKTSWDPKFWMTYEENNKNHDKKNSRN